MIELIDKVIGQAISQGIIFNTITLDFWSYEKFIEELSNEYGQKLNKLTGYKEYKVNYEIKGVFGKQYFYIKLT